MRKTALALLALSLFPIPLAGTQSRELRSMVRDTVLDNGLHVIAAANSALPIATIEVVLRGGALAQIEPEDEGLPHILEHMLFKSFDRSGRDWWAERTSELEAASNGTTGDELVTYYLTLPSENVPDGIELLADLVRSPRFEDRTLEAEKLVVRGELERNVADPYFIADMYTDLTLWGDAFQRKNAIGNILTIMSATTDRLEHLYERFYVPNNAALVVTGAIEPDEVFREAERRFSRWERAADPFAELPSPPIAPLFADSVFVVEAEASDVTITLRWLGPAGAQDRDATYAAAAFVELVDLETSPLQRRLVDTGLFSVVTASYEHVNEVSSISIIGRTTPELIGESSRALSAEVAALAEEGWFDADDLTAVVKRLRMGRAERHQTTAGLAHSLARAWGTAGLEYYLGFTDALDALDVTTIRADLGRYIYGKPKIVSMLMSGDVIREHAGAIGAALDHWRPR